MNEQLVFEYIAEVNRYVSGLTKAELAAEGLDKRNELLAKHGIKTSEIFREQIKELAALKRYHKDDAIAVAQLEKEERDLVAQMRKLDKATADANKEIDQQATKARTLGDRMKGAGAGIMTAANAVRAFAALEAVRVITDVGKAGLDAERSINIMAGAIEAANREFGTGVGTLEHWEGFAARFGQQWKRFTRGEIAAAITQTVDMTKRLGLNAAQMEIVLQRSAALSVGKTTLASAIERTTSALRGEAESAEKLGLSLSRPQLETFLLANGLDKKLIPKLTEAQLAQARYMLFLEQTNEVMTRANQLSESHAGKLDMLIAKWGTAKEQAGSLVIEFAELVGFLDLANLDLERFAARWLDFFNVVAKFTPDPNDDNYFTNLVDDSRKATQGTQDVISATDQLANSQQAAIQRMIGGGSSGIKGLIKEIEQTVTTTERRKTLLDQEVEKHAALTEDIRLLNGTEQQRLQTLIRQNAALELQMKILRDYATGKYLGERVGFYTTTTDTQDTFLTPEEADRRRQQQELARRKGPSKNQRKATAAEEFAPDTLTNPYAGMMDSVAEYNRQTLESMKHDWFTYFTANEQGMQQMQMVGDIAFSGLADLAGAAYELMGEKGGAFYLMYQGAAAAQAVWDTYSAANAAYKSLSGIPVVGPALATAAAVGITASGLANVTRIVNTKPGKGKATGGGGGGASGGGAPAVSASGVGLQGINQRIQQQYGGGLVGMGRRIVDTRSGAYTPPATVPFGAYNSTSTERQMKALESATQALHRAADNIPDTLETSLTNEAVHIAAKRGEGRITRGLGSF